MVPCKAEREVGQILSQSGWGTGQGQAEGTWPALGWGRLTGPHAWAAITGPTGAARGVTFPSGVSAVEFEEGLLIFWNQCFSLLPPHPIFLQTWEPWIPAASLLTLWLPPWPEGWR